jgi:hypothetical protein
MSACGGITDIGPTGAADRGKKCRIGFSDRFQNFLAGSSAEQSERRLAVPRYQLVHQHKEAIMRKFAIALVAAITVGATLPAAAQIGFYAGPAGIGVGVGSPGYYDYGPYYHHRHFHHWHHGHFVRSW